MLQDLKKCAENIKREACFMSLSTLAVYDGLFEFGEDMKGAAAHFSVKIEQAARQMHSQNRYEAAAGLAMLKEISRGLALLVKDVDPWAGVHDEK